MDEIVKKAGGVFVSGFEGTAVPRELLEDLSNDAIAGVILFKRNIGSPGDLAALTESVYKACKGSAPIVSVDQEGGRVQRLTEPWRSWPSAGSMGDSRDTVLINEVGFAMGVEMAAAGFNLDFAPVLDTHTNPENPIIGDRAFASDPEDVARFALAYADGLQRAGIAPCGKHFPGHGDTVTDSHKTLPRVEHNDERLRRVELHPFAAAVSHLPAIMTAHVVFPAWDKDHPATLSGAIIRGILRDELGFSGLVVSDDLEMKAVSERYSPGESAVRCIRAGVDLMLVCRSREVFVEARKRLIQEARRDGVFAGMLEDAWKRVQMFRKRLKVNLPDRGLMERLMAETG